MTRVSCSRSVSAAISTCSPVIKSCVRGPAGSFSLTVRADLALPPAQSRTTALTCMNYFPPFRGSHATGFWGERSAISAQLSAISSQLSIRASADRPTTTNQSRVSTAPEGRHKIAHGEPAGGHASRAEVSPVGGDILYRSPRIEHLREQSFDPGRPRMPTLRGSQIFFPARTPGLAPWAILCRPSGAEEADR